MIKVAVCDDQKIILEEMFNKIKKISKTLKQEIEIYKFSNGNTLLLENVNQNINVNTEM